eukprot:2062030-Rhodomonas_salina.1
MELTHWRSSWVRACQCGERPAAPEPELPGPGHVITMRERVSTANSESGTSNSESGTASIRCTGCGRTDGTIRVVLGMRRCHGAFDVRVALAVTEDSSHAYRQTDRQRQTDR